MALLCADYKVLSRALSNRLKDYLEVIIQMDRSYCVPDRTMMDNLFLIRDILPPCQSATERLLRTILYLTNGMMTVSIVFHL